MSSLDSRVESFRSLRRRLEASVLPLATSLDGRRFSFQAALDGLALQLGGYVLLEGEGHTSLGQVRSLQVADVDAGEIDLAQAERAEQRTLGLRIENLGVARMGVWARSAVGSVLDALEDEAVRCLVVDLGSLDTREEQSLVAESVLRRLWDIRARRAPILLVIDEARNVCPRAPGDALTALATEHAVQIAGEGRKFGMYLLVASQRPPKVHENVLSQCDNLVLMTLNSAADAAFIRELYGFAPPGLVGLSTDFRLGEALVAGKMASHPAIVRFGRRVTREGGADVDSSWAASRDAPVGDA